MRQEINYQEVLKVGGGDAGNGLQDKHAATRCISHPWDIPHPTPAEWSGLY